MTSSPCFQFAGVETLCLAVSCIEFEHPQNLVEVAARRHRVGQHELDLLVGADDEDRAHCLVQGRRAIFRGAGLLGGQHVVELRHLEIAVGDDRIIDPRALRLLDVAEPAGMAVDRIDAEPDELGVASGELGFDLGHVAELRRADGGEILGVGEEDRPAVADPVVEVDRPLGGLGGEVGRGVVKAKNHGEFLSRGCCFRDQMLQIDGFDVCDQSYKAAIFLRAPSSRTSMCSRPSLTQPCSAKLFKRRLTISRRLPSSSASA